MTTCYVTNISGTITTGGAAQTLLPANPGRQFLMIQNPVGQAEVLRVCFDATATTTNSIELSAGGVLEYGAEGGEVPSGTVSILAATSAHPFIAMHG